jgi:protein-disulfide isomerase
MMRRRTLITSSLALAAALALPGMALAQDAAIAIPDMVLGSPDAPVTVVEYASFTCPHCQNFHATVFGELKKNYIDTGKVKFVYREVYFDKYGLWASMVARCGGEMKYFGIADIIYDTQKDWIGDGQDLTIGENLKKIGLTAGIAPDALDACMQDNDMAKALVANYQKNAEADGVEATPTFFVDGEKYSNMSYEDFARILDERLGG